MIQQWSKNDQNLTRNRSKVDHSSSKVGGTWPRSSGGIWGEGVGEPPGLVCTQRPSSQTARTLIQGCRVSIVPCWWGCVSVSVVCVSCCGLACRVFCVSCWACWRVPRVLRVVRVGFCLDFVCVLRVLCMLRMLRVLVVACCVFRVLRVEVLSRVSCRVVAPCRVLRVAYRVPASLQNWPRGAPWNRSGSMCSDLHPKSAPHTSSRAIS